VLLRCNGQRGELLIDLLDLQGGAIGDQRAIRQADAQRVADLGAFDGERIVITMFSAARYATPAFAALTFARGQTISSDSPPDTPTADHRHQTWRHSVLGRNLAVKTHF
jgi:hypothetical protein